MDKTKSRMAAQEMKDLEKLSAKERMDLMKKAGKMGSMASPMAKNVIDPDEPTPTEKEMMRQKVRERKMDEGTERGASQYNDLKEYKKGGMVSKGNGCAIRGTRKCKIC